MKWYVYVHKFTLGASKRKVKSLQTNIGKFMIRFFYCRGLFYVYVFDTDIDVAIDVDVFRTKNEALTYIEEYILKLPLDKTIKL